MHLAIEDPLDIVSTLVVRLMVTLLMGKINSILILSNDIVIFLASTLRFGYTFGVYSRRLVLDLSLVSVWPSSVFRVRIQSVTGRSLLYLTGPVIGDILHHIEWVDSHSRWTYGVSCVRPAGILIPCTDRVEGSISIVCHGVPHRRSTVAACNRINSFCVVSLRLHQLVQRVLVSTDTGGVWHWVATKLVIVVIAHIQNTKYI